MFCSSTENLNKEDMLPAWFRKIILERGGSKVEAYFGNRPPKIFEGPLTSKCVCTSCNGGWMSTLERCAKKVITPLMIDISFSLDSLQQWLLSIWAVKTAMVFESTDRKRTWFYTQDERTGLLEFSKPPDGAVVWIGRHAQSNLVDGIGTFLHASESPTNPLTEGHVTSFLFFRLIIQVLNLRVKPNFQHVDLMTVHLKPGPWNRGLIQIWPVRQRLASWPPPLSFSDHGTSFEELSKRFTVKR